MTDIENPISYDTCSICLSENKNPIITDCSHKYCKKCFEEWLDTGTNKCPMCRKNINTYKNNNDNYKLVLINSNNSSIRQDTQSVIVNTHPILARKITFYKFYLYFAFLLLIYMNYLFGKQLFINNLLEVKYQNCIENITDITENINYENNIQNEDKYTNVMMMMPDQSFRRCMIPEKYYMYC